jgi:hypothetical protein
VESTKQALIQMMVELQRTLSTIPEIRFLGLEVADWVVATLVKAHLQMAWCIKRFYSVYAYSARTVLGSAP